MAETKNGQDIDNRNIYWPDMFLLLGMYTKNKYLSTLKCLKMIKINKKKYYKIA